MTTEADKLASMINRLEGAKGDIQNVLDRYPEAATFRDQLDDALETVSRALDELDELYGKVTNT